MNRINTFTFRVNQDERNLIASLAKRLQRSRSDAVRFVVVNAMRELESQEGSYSLKDSKAYQNEK